MSKKKPPEGPDLFNYVPPVPSTRQMAEEGMQRAVDHANDVQPGWSDKALELVKLYAKKSHGFLTEEVRTWAHGECDLDLPPDPRSWGAVMAKAKAARIVEPAGFRSTAIPPAHAKPMQYWRSLEGITIDGRQ